MGGLNRLLVLAVTATALAGCATQGAMTVESGAVAPASPKYRNAMSLRAVTGGQAMNILTIPGVPNEPFKAALENSLNANGYMAKSGPAKYVIEAEIKNLDQPLIGLNMDVTAAVTYTVTGGGTSTSYPISAKGSAGFSDSPIGADRVRIANERAMQQNIKLFLQSLR